MKISPNLIAYSNFEIIVKFLIDMKTLVYTKTSSLLQRKIYIFLLFVSSDDEHEQDPEPESLSPLSLSQPKEIYPCLQKL